MDNSSPFYLLRWSDHITNYAEMFLTLREEEEFVDCSIACDDGVVGAHRIVLAGCSPYLRDLLKRSTSPHPIIFLVNVSRSTVLLLLEFIYRGQAHIPFSRLHQLVSLGKSMQIKGISKIVLPESNTSMVGCGLPIIPRLHGMPDPLTEVMSDSTSERDSSNHPSPSSFSGSASEDLGTNSSRTSNVRTMEAKKDAAKPHKPRQNIRMLDDDSMLSTPKPKKQKQGEQPAEPELEHQNRISVTKDSASEVLNNNLSKNRLLDNTISSETRASSGNKMKRGGRSISPYVPKPKSKQAKRNSVSLSSPERSIRNVSSRILEQQSKVEKESKRSEERGVRHGTRPINNKGVKGKPAVFKVKKLPPIGRVKREPKAKLYRSGQSLQMELGAHAIRHGMEISQRYILAKYGVKIRRKSLEKMMAMCSPSYSKKKNMPKRNTAIAK